MSNLCFLQDCVLTLSEDDNRGHTGRAEQRGMKDIQYIKDTSQDIGNGMKASHHLFKVFFNTVV